MGENESILNARIKNVVKKLCDHKLDEQEIEYISKELFDIYCNDAFRHEYSSITSVLVKNIFQDNKRNGLDSNEGSVKEILPTTTLEANLSNLKFNFKHCYADNSEVIRKFNKLCDHIELETIRLDYLSDIKIGIRSSKELQNKIDGTQKQLNDTNGKIDNAIKRLKDTNDKIDNAKSGYIAQVITVLSIFAAIVITFSGGLTLLGSGLKAIQEYKSPYRLFFMFGLFGFIMYNSIIGLMFIVCRMNHKNIGVVCKAKSNCVSCKYYHPGIRNILCQALDKYPYIFAVEYMFLYYMYLIFVFWSFTTGNKEIFPQVLHMGNYILEIVLILLPGIVTFMLNKHFKIRKNKY